MLRHAGRQWTFVGSDRKQHEENDAQTPNPQETPECHDALAYLAVHLLHESICSATLHLAHFLLLVSAHKRWIQRFDAQGFEYPRHLALNLLRTNPAILNSEGGRFVAEHLFCPRECFPHGNQIGNLGQELLAFQDRFHSSPPKKNFVSVQKTLSPARRSNAGASRIPARRRV